MNDAEKTDWGKSVAGVVIRDEKVLLVRHTYGAGKGMLIVPGGYINKGETPEAAVCREIYEETGIKAEPKSIIGIRFNLKDWYVVFRAEYVSGKEHSDCDENSEAVWLDVKEALAHDDVSELTKKILMSADKAGFENIPYKSRENHGTFSFYA